MKRFFTLLTVGTSALFLASSVSAETTVNVNSNTGGNTVCVNGKCTTSDSEGTSKSEVCVNGKCWNSENGDVDYQSEDGKTKVTINTNSATNVTQEGEKVVEESKKVVEEKKAAVEQEVKAAKDTIEDKKTEIENKKKEAEQKVKEVTGFNLMDFLTSELESLKKLFTLDFLFGKRGE